MILHRLGGSERFSARKTKVCVLSNEESREFFDRNHLYGHRDAKFCFGLVDDSGILMAISVSGERELEIIRLASRLCCSVRGGFSKLLSYVVRSLNPVKIFSFADLCFSDAHGYDRVGFRVVGLTRPGYFCEGWF